MVFTAHTAVSEPTRKRIVQTCVRLFLTQGYEKTTMLQILRESQVTNSSFQNLFHSKDGILEKELTPFMFTIQFDAARQASEQLSPVCLYAVETAIQLTLTELNENLREIYVLSYTKPNIQELIVQATAKELRTIFSPYLPECTEEDFYYLDLGTSGIMRNFMAKRCSEDFPLEKKLSTFLSLSLRAYNVPQAEIAQAIALVNSLDICTLAQQAIKTVFETLQMHYEFTLPNTVSTF